MLALLLLVVGILRPDVPLYSNTDQKKKYGNASDYPSQDEWGCIDSVHFVLQTVAARPLLLASQKPEDSGLKSDKSDSADKRRTKRGCTQRTTMDHLIQGRVAEKHPAGVRQLIYQTNEMPNDL